MNIEPRTYDVVVVSSSPIMILEAIRLKQKGLSVCVFDERERIGGAWYVKDLFGYTNVEVGCHFIYNKKEVYQLLEHLTQKVLKPMHPQPKIIISGIDGDQEIKGRWANFKFTMKKWIFKDRTLSCRQIQIVNGIRETIQLKRPGKFFKGVGNFFRYVPYQYFDRGCGEFMEEVNKLIEQNGIEVQTNTRINDVVVQPNKGGSFVVNGQVIKFNKILISKHIKFDSLTLKEKINYERTPWRKKHFVFNIKGEILKAISYVDVANDPVLKRISNVGIYCDGLKKGYCLLCSDTTEEIDEKFNNEEIKDLIFNRLKELGIINNDAMLDDWFVEKFVSDYTPKEKLKELYDDSEGVIISIDTSDLGKSLAMYKTEWKTITI